MPDNSLCPYFTEGFVEIVLTASLKSHKVPTPTCRLAEIMLARLRTTPGGQEVAAALTMAPDTAAPRSMYGCDLAPPVREACTLERLQTRCVAGFTQMLTEHSLSAELPVGPAAAPEGEPPLSA